MSPGSTDTVPRGPARDCVRELTRAIASGDTEAFGRFYEIYFDVMYRFARRFTRRDESFCLDVVQDAMMRVIRKMTPKESEAQLLGWVRLLVKSSAVDRLRAEARRHRREGLATRSEPAAMEETEPIAWLRRELAAMDRAQAQLLIERFRFGWTLGRIGAALGLSPGAVDGRINRLVANLRRKAMEQFNDT